MRGLIIGAVFVLTLPVAAGAAPHRLRVHPNPSITIFSIAEGPDGFLWLAAADGLYRFDGFHYHKIASFPFGSARFVAFTGDGLQRQPSRETRRAGPAVCRPLWPTLVSG